MADDVDILSRISQLVEQEHSLERAGGAAGLDEEHASQLRDIEVALDQCWDLLRQRRARRNAGQDPDGASVRPEETVEHYKQ